MFRQEQLRNVSDNTKRDSHIDIPCWASSTLHKVIAKSVQLAWFLKCVSKSTCLLENLAPACFKTLLVAKSVILLNLVANPSEIRILRDWRSNEMKIEPVPTFECGTAFSALGMNSFRIFVFLGCHSFWICVSSDTSQWFLHKHMKEKICAEENKPVEFVTPFASLYKLLNANYVAISLVTHFYWHNFPFFCSC